LQWKQRCQDQHNIIKELIAKMADYGIEVTEEELMEMQHQGADQDPAQQVEYGQTQGQIKAGASMDLIVSYSPSRGKEAITKQMQGAYFESFEEMRETLRKEFEISHVDEFCVKFVNDDGSLTELAEENWDQITELG
tara:strand:+ start:618 stop:1028 length:411 start_codon:yes stop_codon:yes gene_type:complete